MLWTSCQTVFEDFDRNIDGGIGQVWLDKGIRESSQNVTKTAEAMRRHLSATACRLLDVCPNSCLAVTEAAVNRQKLRKWTDVPGDHAFVGLTWRKASSRADSVDSSDKCLRKKNGCDCWTHLDSTFHVIQAKCSPTGMLCLWLAARICKYTTDRT